MLLLIIVCAEINNIGAVVEQHRLKSSAKAAGIVVASSKDLKEEKGGTYQTFLRADFCPPYIYILLKIDIIIIYNCI